MITQTFEAPIGSGLRQALVGPAACVGRGVGRYSGITVIVPDMALRHNWEQHLPNDTVYITPLMWLRRAKDVDNSLIICDELSRWHLCQIKSTLHGLKCEVWLVNPRSPELSVDYKMKVPKYIDPGYYTATMHSVTEDGFGNLCVTFDNVKPVVDTSILGIAHVPPMEYDEP